MKDNQISVIDAAARLGMSKQTLFKLIGRLGIGTYKAKSSANKGQAIAYISNEDFDLLAAQTVRGKARDAGQPDSKQGERGVFYLIELEPGHDPGRYKVGFASNMDERLRQHHCSAPFASIVATWPCQALWEKTAIDCVTQGCVKLHTEVFRTSDIAAVRTRCNQFFSLMPSPNKTR